MKLVSISSRVRDHVSDQVIMQVWGWVLGGANSQVRDHVDDRVYGMAYDGVYSNVNDQIASNRWGRG
jgi:hypothetical protein